VVISLVASQTALYSGSIMLCALRGFDGFKNLYVISESRQDLSARNFGFSARSDAMLDVVELRTPLQIGIPIVVPNVVFMVYQGMPHRIRNECFSHEAMNFLLFFWIREHHNFVAVFVGRLLQSIARASVAHIAVIADKVLPFAAHNVKSH
jgi:hypothetical protein